MRSIWVIDQCRLDDESSKKFSNIDAVFDLKGELIAESPISHVIKVNINGVNYYVKRYTKPGKYLRKFAGRSRIKAEWENLLFFESLKIDTTVPVAYGQKYSGFIFDRGAMITREIENSVDLIQVENSQLEKSQWIEHVTKTLARYTLRLHQSQFSHNDLKWRNVLVTIAEHTRIYLIDCPSGRKVPPFLMGRAIIKDLACLDKVAKYRLSLKQRVRFMHCYLEKNKLSRKDRLLIQKVTRFFEGRE